MNEAYPLPTDYLRRMKAQLGDQADVYFAALEAPYLRGLRLNPRKPLTAEWIDGLEAPVPWQADTGRYLSVESTVGVHPLHEAGACYLQEPSAMIPVSVLAPQPGERILDLCAAPGGKSTQIADRLHGEGLLVCNEPVPSRAKILSRNLERMGVRNALAVSAEPEQLAALWPECFDAVLVDAPCSGEGMFRRHPESRAQWSEQAPIGCAVRQKRILAAACAMLREGGRLVYSTCTFNHEENDDVITWLLKEMPELNTVAFAVPVGGGRLLHSENGVLHLHPHEIRGEGHFAALLQKRGDAPAMALAPACDCLAKPDPAMLAAYHAFAASAGADVSKAALPSPAAQFGDVLVAAPALPPLRSVKVLRAGVHLGGMKGKLFFPDHALAMALTLPYALPTCPLTLTEARAYQRGETLNVDESLSGFILATLEGLALGFGKATAGQLKNHYPKGLRRP